MATKMTYASVLADVLNGVELTPEHIEKLEAMKASYEKKASSKSDKPSKKQVENAELAERLFAEMEPGVSYDSKGAKGLLPELADEYPQKIASLMKILGDRVVAEKVKGKMHYRIAE